MVRRCGSDAKLNGRTNSVASYSEEGAVGYGEATRRLLRMQRWCKKQDGKEIRIAKGLDGGWQEQRDQIGWTVQGTTDDSEPNPIQSDKLQ